MRSLVVDPPLESVQPNWACMPGWCLRTIGTECGDDRRMFISLLFVLLACYPLNGSVCGSNVERCLWMCARLARLAHLNDRRPIMLSSVMLRQNPHNVHEWHKRVKLFGGDVGKQIRAYTEAIQSVDCFKALTPPWRFLFPKSLYLTQSTLKTSTSFTHMASTAGNYCCWQLPL